MLQVSPPRPTDATLLEAWHIAIDRADDDLLPGIGGFAFIFSVHRNVRLLENMIHRSTVPYSS